MTKIEWTTSADGTPGKTWNPVVGCSRVSAGCEHCYAERLAHRGMTPQHRGLTVKGKHGPRWTGEVRLVESALEKPLSWRKPRRIFVNSMSDLFHASVPDEWIDRVFAVMALCPQHTFIVLTKRADRMRRYFSDATLYQRVLRHADALRSGRVQLGGIGISDPTRMLPKWIHLGVSCEDQKTADERIPELLQTPAAVRVVSYEPALGPVDFGWIASDPETDGVIDSLRGVTWIDEPLRSDAPRVVMPRFGGTRVNRIDTGRFNRIDQIIVGGESGPGARPCDVAWIRSVVEQCRAAEIACFVKQVGSQARGWCNWPHHDTHPPIWLDSDGTAPEVSGRPAEDLSHAVDDCWWPCKPKLRDRAGGYPEEWPEGIRVRELPESRS